MGALGHSVVESPAAGGSERRHGDGSRRKQRRRRGFGFRSIPGGAKRLLRCFHTLVLSVQARSAFYAPTSLALLLPLSPTSALASSPTLPGSAAQGCRGRLANAQSLLYHQRRRRHQREPSSNRCPTILCGSGENRAVPPRFLPGTSPALLPAMRRSGRCGIPFNESQRSPSHLSLFQFGFRKYVEAEDAHILAITEVRSLTLLLVSRV